jgi:hypothetical protein
MRKTRDLAWTILYHMRDPGEYRAERQKKTRDLATLEGVMYGVALVQSFFINVYGPDL